MASSVDGRDRSPGWRMVGLGLLLAAAGGAGAAFAWFPAPPHSTAPPLTGWPARWFAAGFGWFGLVVVAAGVADLQGGSGPSRSLVWAARGAFALASACWAAWTVSLLPW